jgi:hypothetical protein
LVIAFPTILASYAAEAGIPVPPDPDKFLEMKEEYPQFAVYCLLQLGTSMPNAMSARTNADVIASIPVEEVTTMTLTDFEARGFEHGVAPV